jgi:general secretion pathway protein A
MSTMGSSMYNAYFGFREKPFKLVPNPEYLFLSRSHEEALAHLNYAISQGEGFVEITGEVGTGKTTLCRAFLEGLDENTVAAYIFNPKLSPKQLIRNINDEFGIEYDTDDTKDLIDTLNRFLLQKKNERKRVIILIDEAQNLSKTVLEQLRLLSNLETNKEKLLQIILVGQPELAAMLDSHELRQIGQRISMRCQISPLSLRETREYVEYRLNIASQKPLTLFDPSAIRLIYAHSAGVPRVINIACDRALLTAFGMNKRKVTHRIAKAALSEMTHRGRTSGRGLMDGRKALALFMLLCVAAAVLLYHQPLSDALRGRFKSPPAEQSGNPEAGRPSASLLQPTTAGAAASASAEALPGQSPPLRPADTTGSISDGSRLSDLLKQMDGRASRSMALKDGLQAWGASLETKPYLEAIDDDSTFFNLSAKAAGFFIQRIEADLGVLRNLNMPAILEFRTGPKRPAAYLVLSGTNAERILLKGPGAAPLVPAAGELQQSWSGAAYILWKNFLSIEGTIPGSAPADSIVALKMLLRELGHKNLPLSRVYDSGTQRAIEQIQGKYGLPVDGVVGPLTKIVLYREGTSFEIPRLTGQ